MVDKVTRDINYFPEILERGVWPCHVLRLGQAFIPFGTGNLDLQFDIPAIRKSVSWGHTSLSVLQGGTVWRTPDSGLAWSLGMQSVAVRGPGTGSIEITQWEDQHQVICQQAGGLGPLPVPPPDSGHPHRSEIIRSCPDTLVSPFTAKLPNHISWWSLARQAEVQGRISIRLVGSRGKKKWDFPGSPVVRTPCFYCRGHRFNPWSGSQGPTSCVVWENK